MTRRHGIDATKTTNNDSKNNFRSIQACTYLHLHALTSLVCTYLHLHTLTFTCMHLPSLVYTYLHLHTLTFTCMHLLHLYALTFNYTHYLHLYALAVTCTLLEGSKGFMGDACLGPNLVRESRE